ncbi:hypothetical protein ACQKWADRAFT_279443 [Trichoderma austrokoningii]
MAPLLVPSIPPLMPPTMAASMADTLGVATAPTPAPAINASSGSVIRLVPGLVAIQVEPVHHYFDQTPEGPTELGFSYAFLGAVGIAFIVLILVDVWMKHGPKSAPGERSWFKVKFDKAKGRYFVCKDTFNRLFISDKRRLEEANKKAKAQKVFDSQKIIDRLAAKPATEKAPSMVEETEEKNVGPMAGIEVKVTPLDMPFLRDGAAADTFAETVAKDGTPKTDDGAPGL